MKSRNYGIVPGDLVCPKEKKTSVVVYRNRELGWGDTCGVIKARDYALVIGSYRRRERDGRLKTKVLVMTMRNDVGWIDGKHLKCLSRET